MLIKAYQLKYLVISINVKVLKNKLKIYGLKVTNVEILNQFDSLQITDC